MTGARKVGISPPRNQVRAIVLTAVMLLSVVSGIPFAGPNGIAAADHGGDVEFESLIIDVDTTNDLTNISATVQGDDSNRVSYLYFQLQKQDGSTIGGGTTDFAIVPNGSSLTATDIQNGASEIDNVDKVFEIDQEDSITDFDVREIDDFPAGQTDKIDQINFKIYEEDGSHVLLHEITLAVGDKLSGGDDLIESDEIATSNGTANSTDFDSAIVVDEGVNVTGGPYENGIVSIDRGFDSDADRLAVDGPADENPFETIAYNSTTGELAVVPAGDNATADEYEQLFRNVTYNNTDDRPDTAEREITFSLTTNASARTDAVYNPQTGHWYEQVDDSGITWTDARDAAAERGGYLATIRSEEENAFVRDRVRAEGWLGGTDAADEGEWHWVTGPEGKESGESLKGIEFFNQTAAHVAWTDPYPAPPAGVPGGGETVDGEYANWNPRHEPDNKFPFRGGEDYAYFSYGTPGNTPDGQWLDGSADSPNFDPEGYIVEYDDSPVSGTADVLNASRNVTYVAGSSPQPTAGASANATTIDAGESVEFNASTSSDADFYEWDVLGDGQTDLTGSTPEYTFTNPGTYEVNLTVTNATSGLTDTDSVEITVANVDKPNAVLSAPDEAHRGEDVQFDGTNSTDSVGIESFEWDFGDGTTSNEVSPVHGYSETGTYTVELNVTDVDGNYNTTTHDITVVESPRPKIDDFELTSPASNELNVSFTSNTSLDTVTVEIFDSDEVTPSPDDSDARLFNVTRSDLDENQSSGNYTYTNTTSGLDGGNYTARLTKAEDSNGRDGGFGQESETTVSTTEDATGPPAPTNPSATAIAGGDVAVSFDDVNESTVRYTIYRNNTSTTAGFKNVTTVTDDNSTTYMHTDSGLIDGTTYEYNVSATDEAGNEGPNSTTVSATADATAPSISDENFSLTNPQNRDLNVTFTSDEQLATIEVQHNDSGDTTVATLTTGDFTETNNGDGTYTYTNTSSVGSDGTYESTLTKAEDEAGNDGSAGQNATVTVDAAVNFTLQSGDITAGPITSDNESSYSVDVAFPADNEAGNLNVTLVGPTGTTAANTSVDVPQGVGTVTVTSLDAADLDDGSVEVIANFTDDAGNVEQNSTTVTKDTTAPDINDENLTIENPQDRDLNVTFTSNESLTTIILEISNVTGDNDSVVRTLEKSDFTRTENGDGTYAYTNTSPMTSDGTYEATLRKAEDAAGNDGAAGQNDTVEIDTEGPTAPQNITATVVPDGDITVTFDDVNESTVRYTIYRNNTSTAAGFENVTTVTDDNSTGYTYTDSGLSDGTTYEYNVSATDDTGNEGPPSAVASTTADAKAPSISSFTVANPSGQDVTVSFDSDENLTTISVDLDLDGSDETTLNESDFTNTTGTYTATYSGNSDGSYNATLKAAEDGAGNDGASGQTDEVTIDTSGPAAPSTVTATAIEGGDITVSFDDVNESTVRYTIYHNNTSTTAGFENLTTVTDDNSSKYTYTDTGLSDGTTYEYNVSAIDENGFEGPNSTTVSATADATAPTISGSNFSLTNSQNRDLNVTFTSDEEVANISVAIAGPDNATLTTSDFTESDDGNGTYTYQATYSVSSDGDYTATLDTAEDSTGNDGASGESDSVTVDTIVPSISSFNTSNPSGQDVNVSFDSDEQLATIRISITGAETATLTASDFTETEKDGNYTYTVSYSGSSDGEYTITLEAAEDSAGNDGSNSESETVTVDTTAPAISSFNASNPSGQDVRVSFDSDEPMSNLTVSISGAETATLTESDFSATNNEDGTYIYEATYNGSTEGDYTATLTTAEDGSGNDGASGESDSVTVDTIAPSISSFNVSNHSEQNLNVSFDSDEQLATISVSITGAESATLTESDFTETDDGDGTYTYELLYPGSSDGEYTVTLEATEDSAGNDGSNSESETVTVDTAAPTVSSFNVSNPSGQDLTVSFDSNEPVSTISVSITGAETATLTESDFSATNNEDGTYTYEATYSGSTEGDYTATLDTAEDTAGNDDSNESDTVTVDTIAPSISSFNVNNPSGQDLNVSFDSDEPVSNITVAISGAENATMTESAFTETDNGDGTYSYVATYSGSTDGSYTITLDTAEDANDNDGAGNESETVSMDTTAPSISSFNVSNPSEQDVNVSFDSNEPVSNISVSIGGAENATLTESDFSETTDGDGYSYEATYSGSTDGNYTATLETAEDAVGNNGATGQSGSVGFYADLAADITADSALVSLGSEVSFGAERSSIPEDVTPSYEWKVNDSLQSTSANFTHAFNTTGEHSVTLTIDVDGAVVTDEVTITVEDREPPAVKLVANDTEPSVDDTVHLDATGSTDNDAIDSYEWDITGEGTLVDEAVGERNFTYEAPGTFRETVTVTDNSGNENDRTVKIAVQGPNASIHTDSIDFGTTTLNSTNLTSITVSNDGTTPLNVTNASFADPDGPFALTGDASSSLPVVHPGSSRSIAIAFEPTVVTTNQTTLTIEHNATHLEDATVDLKGTGVESNLSVDDSLLGFGKVSIDETPTRTVEITNEGPDATEITDLAIAGSTPDAFEIGSDGGLPGELGSGTSATIEVAFDPVRSGEQTATLRIETADGTVTTVSLEGTGTGPEIALPDGDIDFGAVGTGNESTEAVRIANYGSEPLDIQTVTVTGADDSVFTVENSPETVAAGKTASVDVTFAPEEAGNHTAVFEVDSNDSAAGTVENDLDGSAVDPSIDADPRNVDFGNVTVGETVSYNITVENLHSSKSNLTVRSTQITGKDPTHFDVADGSDAPFSLEPGETRDIEVNFTPASSGTKEAQLQIMSNAGNEPQIDVWLSNTKTYVVVQEVAADADQNSSAVNLDANNVQSGTSFDINVSKPGTREHNASIDTIQMNTTYEGNFEMNITHQESPITHTLDETDRETVQYIEQTYTVDSSVFEDTSFDYRVSSDSIPDGVAPESVTFYRYNTSQGAWVSHESTLSQSSDAGYVYSVETPGFSELAISVPIEDTSEGSSETVRSGESDGVSDDDPTTTTPPDETVTGPTTAGPTTASDDTANDGTAGDDGATDSPSGADESSTADGSTPTESDDNTAGAGLLPFSPLEMGIAGTTLLAALMSTLFLLGRQQRRPHRIGFVSGSDDRWSRLAAGIAIQERDRRELEDSVTVTAIDAGGSDESGPLSAINEQLPWELEEGMVTPLESIDVADYDTIVSIGTLPATLVETEDIDVVHWSVPDVSDKSDADGRRTQQHLHAGVDDLFDTLEQSPDTEGDNGQ